MDLTGEYEPVVVLNDGETFSSLSGSALVLLTREEAHRVAADGCLPVMLGTETPKRTFDLERIVRWAFANGYQPG
jgi:hypothetical protein